MLIDCPTCAASYEVELAKLAPKGRTVRCARCKATWFAEIPITLSALVQIPAAPLPGERAKALSSAAPPLEGNRGDFSVEPAEALHDGANTPPANVAGAGAPVIEPTDVTGGSENALILADAPPLMPVLDNPAPEETAPGQAVNIETHAARRRRAASARKKKTGMKPGLAAIILGLAALLAGLVAWRTQVVRIVPQSASLFSAIGLGVNVRGLAIENVKTMREVEDGVMVLIVEGSVTNVANRIVEVPRLRFALRNPAGLEIYAWTAVAGRTALGTGETASFRTRLASPPADGREVVIRFFHRRDIVAGLK